MIGSRAVALGLLVLTVPLTMGATPPDCATVTVDVQGLRSTRGLIQACLTTLARSFPDCEKDPQALHVTMPAANGPTVVFTNVAYGRYAIALFHDENSNGRLDRMMMIPTEGFGFSRDAPIMFGPPRFGAACFVVDVPLVTRTIHLRYIL